MLRVLSFCLVLAALLLPSIARAVPFANSFPMERFELSGGANFVDEFDDGVFPSFPWFRACGSASEADGALWSEETGTGPLCPSEAFAASPFTEAFITDTILTADFRVVLPAPGEGLGVQVGTSDLDDVLFWFWSYSGGGIGLGVIDENGLAGWTPVDSEDLPVLSYTLQIALVTEPLTGILVPTVSVRGDGDPLVTIPLEPSLGLDPSLLAPGEKYLGSVVAFVPEPTSALLLAAGLAGLAAGRRRRRS